MTNMDLFTTRVSLIAKAQGAFLAAAIGDALGWPQEDRSSRIGKKNGSLDGLALTEFQKWERRSGGRFYPHEESILAGEYSDDTQLLLCTARSLLQGRQWWHHFTRRELPTWSLYERGGGRATLHAVGMWIVGREPWSSPQKTDRQRYFEAGGNGVAMRILPHCLYGVAEEDFRRVALTIVANGVCTHGHPRALIGALAYGFAGWVAFRETSTLQYGAIIEKVLASTDSWSTFPDLSDVCPTWRPAAEEENSSQYEKRWQETVKEMVGLLKQCREAMKQGSLSIEQEVLTQLGCFDRKVNGSGTVAAAAAIFLASRYAVAPLHGLVQAAFSHGADTDTIASMTGGLLGALLGSEWLESRIEQVQDAPYLKGLAESLIQKAEGRSDASESINRVTKAELDSFPKKLQTMNLNSIVKLPDGREATISAPQWLNARSKTAAVESWKLTTAEGQSLYVKKISREKFPVGLNVVKRVDRPLEEQETHLQPVEISRVGVKLPVRDLTKARLFYEKVLGLKVFKESKGTVNFENGVILVPVDYELAVEQKEFTLKSAVLDFRTHSLDTVYKNIVRIGATILTPPARVNGQRFLRCLDPDGNVIELSERV